MLKMYIATLAIAAAAVTTGGVAGAQSVAKTIPLPNYPEAIAVDYLKNLIFVAVPNFGAKPFDYLTVIDGSTDQVVRNIEIPPIAYAVAVNPMNDEVYVGGNYIDKSGVTHNDVISVSEKTWQVGRTIPVSTTEGDGIQGLGVDVTSGAVYASNGSDNEIDLIRDDALADRISVPGEPFGIAVDQFTATVYTALLNGNVSIINEHTKTVTASTAVGTSNAGIAVDFPDGKIYTANQVSDDSSSVGVLNAHGAVVTNISVGNTPFGIDADPLTGLVFVANSQDGTVSVIKSSTNKVVDVLPVSGLFVSINVGMGKVYVGSTSSVPHPYVTVIREK